MKKKDIHLTVDDTHGADWQDGAELDERLETVVEQLLDSEADYGDEDSLHIGSPASRNGSNGASHKSKQEEIEALLERMVFSERAFLEYPN